MQAVTTEAKHPKTCASVTTRILLDCCCQLSYLTQSLANKFGLKAERTEELIVATFGKRSAYNNW